MRSVSMRTWSCARMASFVSARKRSSSGEALSVFSFDMVWLTSGQPGTGAPAVMHYSTGLEACVTLARKAGAARCPRAAGHGHVVGLVPCHEAAGLLLIRT